MKSNNQFDVVFVGNYTKDTIVSPSGTRNVDGGGMNYSSHAVKMLGYKPAVVTRLAKEDDHVVRIFEQDGIDCFVNYSPSSTIMRLYYPTTDPDIRELSVTGTAGSIAAADICNIQAKAGVVGSSLRGEVGLDVILAMREKQMRVAADMQGFVRVLRGEKLVYEPWPEMAETLRHVDVVKSDMVEAEFLTGEKELEKAARVYADMGPQEIVLTHRDGLLIYDHGQCHHFNFHSESLAGRSGRGDTCIGTYMAKRLELSPREAGKWAAAVTSLKVERLGFFNRPIDEVEAFISRYYPNGTH